MAVLHTKEQIKCDVSNTSHIKTLEIILVVFQNVDVFLEMCGAWSLLPDTNVGWVLV